jgi:carbonic anhydrase
MKRLVLFVLVTTSSFSFAQSWGYQNPNGPSQWGTLSPAFLSCQQGVDQSPIDIESGANAGLSNVTPDTALEALAPEWLNSQFNVMNNGHTVEMLYDAGSLLSFEGRDYQLKQFHFHSPSEHIVDGREFPLEAHFVHQSAAGTVVIGVLFAEGSENQALKSIWLNAPHTETTVNVPNLVINANDFLPSDLNYYHYTGSLTTPPCTEGVKWIVLKTPIHASRAQLQFLQKQLGGPNNRPLQPLDGRMIGLEGR